MSSKRAMKQAQKQAYAKHRSNITNNRFNSKKSKFSKNKKQLLVEERLSGLIPKLNKRGHKALSVTDWSEGFILCARKKNNIYDAYADIRSYKSQIFQAQAIAW